MSKHKEIHFLSAAEQELQKTIQYYNDESPGLGYEFANEIRNTLGRIIQYPEAWHPLSNRTRRCRTNRFPYGVIYQIRNDMILIVAIMHMNRKPQSWKPRINNKNK